MAESVLSMALDTLRDLLVEEVRFLSGVGREAKELEKQLTEMKCLIKDTDRRKYENDTVANWISQIRDLAYRSQDAIETYAFHVSSKRSGPHFKRLLRKLACVLSDSSTLHQIASEISEIKSEFTRVMGSMKDYGIRSIVQGEGSTSNENQRWQRKTYTSYKIDDCFVGKEEDMSQLVSLVVDDNEGHRFISLWGMGGIGKTTLAREIINHTEVKQRFECFAWVCITQECQIRLVLEDVLKNLIKGEENDGNFSNLNDRELIEKLVDVQSNKRCVVVLDDIWHMEHWNGLKQAFVVQGLKSKVLVTTRMKDIADDGFKYEVGLLSEDDGLKLLKKKAFHHNNNQDLTIEENSLDQIGKEIVCKCGRLPLAISLMGGILSKKPFMVSEWVSVKENMKTYLFRAQGSDMKKEMDGVFNLSYDELPYYLKPCFLYLGLFKEDQQIDTDELYMLWIAEGMISHENVAGCETLMNVAKLYLHELASRSIVQVCVEESGLGEKHETCQLHDVVRELCLSKGEDFRIKAFNYQGGNLMNRTLSSSETRHAAVYLDKKMEVEHKRYTLPASSTIRSIHLLTDIQFDIELFGEIVDIGRFRLLKTLVIKNFIFPKRELPREIGDLIHLRHLWLENCLFRKVPSSIRKLVYLITLCLRSRIGVRIPNVLQKLIRLKYLSLSQYYVGLDLDGLDELEILEGHIMVHDLKCLTKMKKLTRISALVYDNKNKLYEVVPWERLHSWDLNIKWGCDITIDEEKGITLLNSIFESSIVHHVCMGCRIGYILGKCSTQVDASTLTTLVLDGCEIEDDPMEILGKLPLLKELKFDQNSFVGEEMRCHSSSFPKLTELTLDGLPKLREWTVERGAMPLLSTLWLLRCKFLEMIPDGLKFIDSLVLLDIWKMPLLEKRISKSKDDGTEGEDYHKVSHVPFINAH